MKKLFKFILIITISISIQLFGSNFGKSLLLPGLGEYNLGLKKQSRNFMIAEASIWTAFFLLDDFSNTYKTDYENYAIMNADVNWNNKNNIYAANVGNYDSMYEYNLEVTQVAGWDLRYPENEGYDWDWNGDSIKRNTYDAWRNKSSSYKDLQEFAIAGFILNRIISGFNILIKERKNFITSDLIRENKSSIVFKINYHF